MSLPACDERTVLNLQHWVDGNGCISWEETDFLTRSNDLARILPTESTVSEFIEHWVQVILVKLLKGSNRVRPPTVYGQFGHVAH